MGYLWGVLGIGMLVALLFALAECLDEDETPRDDPVDAYLRERRRTATLWTDTAERRRRSRQAPGRW